ncbi:MAG: hypothetical protein QM779_05130 [Propionicimonas sp.]|uniref:hypothetical protein n=1 Tax=Propionicimonas sp. TaxID=1955623 RepID=UPI003D0F4624
MDDQLMTLRDIAGLARVQRPVVTVWRSRSRGTSRPFPEVRRRSGGQDLFLRDDVVTWLETTGRGNNREARAESAAHALRETATDATGWAALSALLTLRHLTGAPLAPHSVDDLLDLADAEDPDDRCLFAELRDASDLAGLARTVDALAGAGTRDVDAHRRILDGGLRTPGSALALTATGPGAHQLLATLLGPLRAELGEATALMDPTGCAGGLVGALAAALDADVLLMGGTSPAHRLARRELLVADCRVRTVERGDGDWSVTGPVLHLVVLPAADEPAPPPLAHLDLIDEIALQLDERQLVLCLAPAATLTDRLAGPAAVRRDELLRSGSVRAIVRLPAGLRPAVAREHLALWLLAAPEQVPAAERRSLVADLSAEDPAVFADGLAGDLLAAAQGAGGARRRAWARLHPAATGDLISAGGSLVPPRPLRAGTPERSGADWVVDVRAADAAGLLADYRLEVAAGTPELLTVEQARERGWLRVIPGRRVDLTDLPEGGVPVWAADAASAAPVLLRTVDRLSLQARTDAHLTEPGDIVFTARPVPRARIDAEGGALVLAPARVLRVAPGAPLVAGALALRVNAQDGSDWRRWVLATVPAPDGFASALADLARQRAGLLADLAALDALTNDLTAAVESRQLSITKENHGASAH